MAQILPRSFPLSSVLDTVDVVTAIAVVGGASMAASPGYSTGVRVTAGVVAGTALILDLLRPLRPAYSGAPTKPDNEGRSPVPARPPEGDPE